MSSSPFQEKLREIYKGQDQIAPLIEGLEKEIPPQRLDDYYVKLKTIIKQVSEKKSANYETISGRKQEIEVEDLFDASTSKETTHKASINKLLILGGAGVGKSTLMQYIAYRWSQGELWNDRFDYVYRVSLKTLLNVEWQNRYDFQQKDDDVLKCLVHYHFILRLDSEERKNYQLKDMPWLNEKDKILLLLDGYDEVSSDNNESLLKSIFKHANIILTSRPNAINKDMAQRFERKIENIGFDHDGINQYLTWYFKDNEEKKKKGEALEEFLEKNSSIRDICKIPVNIAMMCFIWSEGDSNQALYKVSNMSDLYHQVVDRLGFRYYAKQPFNLGKSEEKLLSEWRGEKQLDELQVLQHIAYKGLTGGGIEVSHEKRTETLIIAGMLAKGDEIGISIQSSINYLQKTGLKREMPIINNIYQYGLLRPEGILVAAKKEPSETDLQSHNFSFIHLSFQEFLTAQYFADRLMDHEDQVSVANFLAQHRNEPRYFLTLKFMTGILSASKGVKAERALQIFWDTIMCNLDGVIELGVETKVTLLMHLLSQTTKEEKIDERIPHRDRAVDLIDSVVLRDFSGWSSQLKESGFSSDNIKEGLIQCWANKTNGLPEKSFELQKELNPNIKNSADSSHWSEEEIMEIIMSMINKFSEKQQNQVFLKACAILKDYSEERWRRTKKAIEFILTIRRKTKINIEIQKEKDILDSLLVTVYDHNLDEVSCKAISEILGNSPNSSSLNDTVSGHIKQGLENLNAEKEYSKLETISHLLLKKDLGDPQLVKDVIHSLTSFFQNPDVKVKLSASINTLKFLRIEEDINPQLVNNILDTLLALIIEPAKSISDSASKQIIQLVTINCHNDPQLIRTTTDKLIPHLDAFLTDVQRSVFSTLMGLGKILANKNIQSIRDDLKMFLLLLKKSNREKSEMISDLIIELIKGRGNSDIQLIQETVDDLIRFIQESTSNSNDAVPRTIIGLIKLGSRNKPQLILETINTCTKLFYHPQGEIRTSTLATITGLTTVNDTNDLQIVRTVLDAFIQLLKGPSDSHRAYLQDNIIHLIKFFKNVELAQETLNSLIQILKHPHNDVKKLAELTIIKLIESSGDNKSRLVKNIMNNLISLLNDPDWEVRLSTSKTLTSLMKIAGINDAQLARKMFDTFTPLLEYLGTVYPDAALDQMLNFIEVNESSEMTLARSLFNTLIPFLKNPFPERNIYQMINLMEKTGSSDTQLTDDIFNTIHPTLTDKQGNVRISSLKAIRVFMKIRGEIDFQQVRDFIATLTLLLEVRQRDPNLKKVAFDLINQLMKASGKSKPQIVQDILDHLTPFLCNSDKNVKNRASTALIQLFKVSGNSDTDLSRKIMNILIPLLKSEEQKERRLALSHLVELGKITGFTDNQIFTDALNNLIPFLQDESWIVRGETPEDIIAITCLSPKKDIQLAKDLFGILSTLLQSDEPSVSCSASDIIIGVMQISGKYDSQLVQKIYEILTSILQKADSSDRRWASDNIIKLIKLTNNAQFIRDTLITSINLLQSNPSLSTMASEVLEKMVLEILLRHPEDLTQYFNHSSKEFREILISSLLQCLGNYVESFEIFYQLFQNPKSLLTLEHIQIKFRNKIKFTKQLSQNIQECLQKMENKDLSKDEDPKHLSELKSLLFSEIHQINTLKGHHIIELALVAIGKERISVDDSNHQKLIERAKEALNIQVNYLNDDGLQWIHDNHEKLISLSPETKSFDRQVCIKLLEHEKMTPLEESLLIKFIKQGLTTSLTRDGEIIFEGKRHKFRGDNIEQAMEKIAKTIIDQQQDILALQYKENDPIFMKSYVGGMKEAAADFKEIKSVVDKRRSLKNDSWLLTTLKSLVNPQSNIILLEKRNAFGDHFIFRLNDEKTFRFYPNELPELEKIFGLYRIGEVYKGTVRELTEEAGQKLFESKNTQDIDNIEGNMCAEQIYFQQELLGKGHEDRNEKVEKELENKLNDNRQLLERQLQSLNISDDKERKKIHEYYEGFVSTFSAVFTSSQAIAVGKLAIDDGTDYFSIINMIIQFKSLDPFGIGDLVAFTLNGIKSHLKTTPIMNEANCVKDIAIDAVELSDLAGKTALDIISDSANRQKIFDAKKEKQPNNLRTKIKDLCTPMLNELKDKLKTVTKNGDLFLMEIETTPAFKLGEDDTNKIIKNWIQRKKSNPSLRMDPKEKQIIFVQVLSTVPVNTPQPNKPTKKKCPKCNIF